MKFFNLILIMFTSFSTFHCFLVRPFDTYNSIILEIEAETEYRNFFYNYSKQSIPTTITDMKTFVLKNKDERRLKKSLFVFLSDSGDIRIDINEVLIPSIDISKPTWLIFFGDRTTIKGFFGNTYIPFDCKFKVVKTNTINMNGEIITEVYRTERSSDLKHNVFAIWTFDEGVKLPRLSLYQRRNNLHGAMLRASIKDNPPWSTIIRGNNRSVASVGGIFGDIFSNIQKHINFTVQYTEVGETGVIENGKWIGGVGSLVSNESDIFVGNSVLVSSRAEVISYTKIIYYSRGTFYFQRPAKYIQWDRYLKAFHKYVWFTILITIFIISGILTCMKIYYRSENTDTVDKSIKSSKISDNISAVFGAFCGQATEKSVVDSINLIQFTLHVTVTIILACYSAILISTLTVGAEIPVFKTIEDLHKADAYTMGMLSSGAFYDYFQSSSDDIMKKVFDKTSRNNGFYKSTKDGFKRVCSDKNYAFFIPDVVGNAFNTKYCTFLSSDQIVSLSMTFGLTRNSPYEGIFNYYISKMTYSGVISNILRRWINNPIPPSEDLWSSVDYLDIAPLLALILINAILSFLILYCERKVFEKRMMKKIATISERLITTIKYPTKRKVLNVTSKDLERVIQPLKK